MTRNAAATAAGAAHAAPPVLFSGLDSSLEGWTRIEDRTTSLSYSASGGYAGGVLRWDFRMFSTGPHNGS